MRRIASAGVSISLLLQPCASFAEVYDALCADSEECQIDVSSKGIGGPSGFIPSEYLVGWSAGKLSDYNAGKGVAGGLGGAFGGALAGTILLGPIGFLGGLIGGGIAGSKAGKEFEGYYTIVGYNKKGDKISHQFFFINPKPAKRLRAQLPILTGLSMGEERSIEEIESSFSGEAKMQQQDGLPVKLGQSKSARAKNKSNCWNEYLKGNPAMSVWAEANPELAEKQRLKSGYELCEEGGN